MPQDIQTKLINTLYQQNLLTEKQLDDLRNTSRKTKKSIEELLVEKNMVDEEQIAQAKAGIYNIAYIDLKKTDIDSRIVNLIPRKVALNYQMVAFRKEGNKIFIGMLDPSNYQAVQAAEFLAKDYDSTAEFYVISQTSFQFAMKQYEKISKDVEAVLDVAGEKVPLPEQVKPDVSRQKVEKIVKSAPISKIVSVIIRHAVEGRASDIHIEPTTRETRVRYRVDGILRTTLTLPLYIHTAIVSRIKVLANLKLDETRKPQDGRMRLNIENKSVDFRVSTMPLIDNEKVVIRILDSSETISTLKELGFSERQVKIIERNLKKQHGLFLVTGPTGSGKTTTLYAALNFLNNEAVNIVTLEDPIEYYLPGINQSQINPEVGFTFASGLRSILRQDPNIIMVGEIRDNETAELVVHASLTGHIVLSTLHTSDAFGAIPRLIDMKIEAFLLSSTINVVIAQRLVRRICQNCREETEISKEIYGVIISELEAIPKALREKLGLDLKKPLVFYHGRGCSECNQTGYYDRMVVTELFEVTDSMRKIIVSGFDLDKAREEFHRQGNITLTQDGFIKAWQGFTTVEEIIRVTQQ